MSDDNKNPDIEQPSIVVVFDDVGSANFSMKYSPNLSVEQVALVAAKLKFFADFRWNMNETERMMEIAEQQQKLAVAKPSIYTPQ